MATDKSAEVILQLLYADSPPRRRKALDRLKAACDAILEQKANASLSEIERFILAEYGLATGPRAQSISNERKRETGMYHYVEARNRENRTYFPRSSRRGKSYNIDEAIDEIEDVGLRVLMRGLLSKKILAEKALVRAKYVIKTIKPGADIDAILNDRPSSPDTMELCPQLIEDASSVLSALSDDHNLRACGLILDEGAIRRRGGTGDELLSKDALSALSTLIARLNNR